MATVTATTRGLAKIGERTARNIVGTVSGDSTIALEAAAASGTEIEFATLSTRARIHGLSQIAFDDLASTGSPVMGLGFKAVDAQFTTSTTALISGLAISSASAGTTIFSDHINRGKRVWEILGLSTDPGGFATLIGTTSAAATVEAGDITLSLQISMD